MPIRIKKNLNNPNNKLTNSNKQVPKPKINSSNRKLNSNIKNQTKVKIKAKAKTIFEHTIFYPKMISDRILFYNPIYVLNFDKSSFLNFLL